MDNQKPQPQLKVSAEPVDRKPPTAKQRAAASSQARTVARRLKFLRESQNLTQDQIGAVIDRSGSHVGRIEQGGGELLDSEKQLLTVHFNLNRFWFQGTENDVAKFIIPLSEMSPNKRDIIIQLCNLKIAELKLNEAWVADRKEVKDAETAAKKEEVKKDTIPKG